MAKAETTEDVKSVGSGVSVYIGPSVRGVIQTATIFEGSPEEAASSPMGALACSQRPKIKDLIVDAADLAEARIKVKTPGEALYKAYRSVLRDKE